jgi:hypothetical protein
MIADLTMFSFPRKKISGASRKAPVYQDLANRNFPETIISVENITAIIIQVNHMKNKSSKGCWHVRLLIICGDQIQYPRKRQDTYNIRNSSGISVAVSPEKWYSKEKGRKNNNNRNSACLCFQPA